MTAVEEEAPVDAITTEAAERNVPEVIAEGAEAERKD